MPVSTAPSDGPFSNLHAKAERLNARALASQVTLDRDLTEKLPRAMREINLQRDVLDDAAQALATTAANLWR
jgi:hypothetical protein